MLYTKVKYNAGLLPLHENVNNDRDRASQKKGKAGASVPAANAMLAPATAPKGELTICKPASRSFTNVPKDTTRQEVNRDISHLENYLASHEPEAAMGRTETFYVMIDKADEERVDMLSGQIFKYLHFVYGNSIPRRTFREKCLERGMRADEIIKAEVRFERFLA